VGANLSEPYRAVAFG